MMHIEIYIPRIDMTPPVTRNMLILLAELLKFIADNIMMLHDINVVVDFAPAADFVMVICDDDTSSDDSNLDVLDGILSFIDTARGEFNSILTMIGGDKCEKL